MGKKRFEDYAKLHATRWVIDGKGFSTVSAAFGFAKANGFKGSLNGLRARLVSGNGTATLSDLVRPLDVRAESCSKARAVVHSNRKKSKDEMAELIAKLDERKKQIGYDY